MKINRLFLFCCACVPGAGQMYLGYMKRGLCLVSAFCLNIFVCVFFSYAAVLLPVVWMYSFFDTYALRRMLESGSFPADDYLFRMAPDAQFDRMLRSRSRMVGWAFIAFGAFALYDNFVTPLLWELISLFPALGVLGTLLHRMPTLVVAVLLIWMGLKLVKGRRPEDDYQDYNGNGGAA